MVSKKHAAYQDDKHLFANLTLLRPGLFTTSTGYTREKFHEAVDAGLNMPKIPIKFFLWIKVIAWHKQIANLCALSIEKISQPGLFT